MPISLDISFHKCRIIPLSDLINRSSSTQIAKIVDLRVYSKNGTYACSFFLDCHDERIFIGSFNITDSCQSIPIPDLKSTIDSIGWKYIHIEMEGILVLNLQENLQISV